MKNDGKLELTHMFKQEQARNRKDVSEELQDKGRNQERSGSSGQCTIIQLYLLPIVNIQHLGAFTSSYKNCSD